MDNFPTYGFEGSGARTDENQDITTFRTKNPEVLRCEEFHEEKIGTAPPPYRAEVLFQKTSPSGMLGFKNRF